MKQMTLYKNEPLTDAQIKEITEAAKQPIAFDADCPELSDAQLAEFAVLAKKQRAERRKKLISLRISPDTYAKAKKLGDGYTGILGRLLDVAINNPEMLKQCL